jgi:type IV secretion system protein VirB2
MQSRSNQSLVKWFFLVLGLALAAVADAQILGNSQGILEQVIGELKTIGTAVVTIAVMFCGFRMVFQAAQWKDVAPIFWGGVLVGGAAAISGILIA